MVDRPSGGEIVVWDPLVRIGHWLLVVAFFVAYFTEDEALAVHTWAGYAVTAYVAIRVIWGFAGPRHARFSDFVYSPFKAIDYLVGLARGSAPRYIGHSPAGAMMVFGLLVCLTGTVVTGMAELARSRGEGPLAPVIERQAASAESEAPQDIQRKNDDDNGSGERREAEGEDEEESLLLELHELFANLTLALVALHILGVAVASWSHKENLVRAMITGRKRSNGA